MNGDLAGIGTDLTALTELRLHDTGVGGHHSALRHFPNLTVATLPRPLDPKLSLPPPNEDGTELSDDELDEWERVADEEFKETRTVIEDCNILFL